MARPLRSNERQFEPAFEPAAYHASYELDSLALDGLHVRALQRRLADAFASEVERSEGLGLTPAQRLGIIVGTAIMLWLAIGTSISFAIG